MNVGWIQESWDVWEEEEIFEEEGAGWGRAQKKSFGLGAGTHFRAVLARRTFSSQECHKDPCLDLLAAVWGPGGDWGSGAVWSVATRASPLLFAGAGAGAGRAAQIAWGGEMAI